MILRIHGPELPVAKLPLLSPAAPLSFLPFSHPLKPEERNNDPAQQRNPHAWTPRGHNLS